MYYIHEKYTSVVSNWAKLSRKVLNKASQSLQLDNVLKTPEGLGMGIIEICSFSY